MTEKKNTHGGRRDNQTGRPRIPEDQKKVQLTVYVPVKDVDAVGGKAEAKRIAAEAIYEQSKTLKMERRKSKKQKVVFDLVVEDPTTGNEIKRYKSEGECQSNDYDAVNRLAQAQEGTLFAHAENPIWE